MNIIINQYIPLVLNKVYKPIILPCLFRYVTTEIIIKVPWLQGCALRLLRSISRDTSVVQNGLEVHWKTPW